MFDDLRGDSQSAQFSDEELENIFEPKSKQAAKPKKGAGGKLFGLNAFQRLVLSVLLFSVTCMLGVILLLFTERIVLF
jgi:hypothetical protein